MMILLDICVISIMTLLFTFAFATGWAIFDKAGQPGWAIFVPIYQNMVALKVCGKPMWWLIFFLIPCLLPLAPIFQILMMIELANRFGKGGGFIAGMILLPYFFMPILAFGKAEYNVPQGAAA
jgi:hypothetical protein